MQRLAGGDPIRIMICSTPKTGNTWLKHLLSAIYDLPIVDLPREPDTSALALLGLRWVGHEHYPPSRTLLRWADAHSIFILTTVRHPADVLLSLMHYGRAFETEVSREENLHAVLARDFFRIGPNVTSFIRGRFAYLLKVSAAWMWTGRSFVVRYEDLWRDPIAVLRRLTDRISPVDGERIERAVESCRIDVMKNLPGNDPRFFRQGSCGGRAVRHPEGILGIFRNCTPYPRLFQALGYTMDPADDQADAAIDPGGRASPFAEAREFDNGVPIHPFLVTAYWSVPRAVSGPWLPVTNTAPANTFWSWLNAPSAEDPLCGKAQPFITNLASFTYFSRTDLQLRYPDPFGADRPDFADWFVCRAHAEHGIDPAFLRPMLESYLAWANSPAGDGLNDDPSLPAVTNLMAHIHRVRADVQQVMPDLRDAHRIDYFIWFLGRAAPEYSLDAASIDAARVLLRRWAGSPVPGDEDRAPMGPRISNAMALLHRDSPELQARFPDVQGRDRAVFTSWFERQGQWTGRLATVYRKLLSDSTRAWADAPAGDTTGSDGSHDPKCPPITNLMLRIYEARADLQERFPDIQGADRLDFVLWALIAAPLEYAEGESVAQPLMDWWIEQA